ncbi:hypothetical protein ADK64_29385 [Streptomyces sp. MMG1121]|nr:hypothetical protein ADK64_29385 [Streptomyces sp. MMG1121]
MRQGRWTTSMGPFLVAGQFEASGSAAPEDRIRPRTQSQVDTEPVGRICQFLAGTQRDAGDDGPGTVRRPRACRTARVVAAVAPARAGRPTQPGGPDAEARERRSPSAPVFSPRNWPS